MAYLSVIITEYVDDSQPGWVRCIFLDADGKEWAIVEKGPIVYANTLTSETRYPQSGQVACQILTEHIDSNNRRVLTIDISFPFAMETEDGQTKFDVFADQVVED